MRIDSSDEDDDIVNTGEKMSIDDMVKLCDQLIGGMEIRNLSVSKRLRQFIQSKKDCLNRNLC